MRLYISRFEAGSLQVGIRHFTIYWLLNVLVPFSFLLIGNIKCAHEPSIDSGAPRAREAEPHS